MLLKILQICDKKILKLLFINISMEDSLKLLPKFTLKINESDNSTGVDLISFVERPAIEVDFVTLNDEKKHEFKVSNKKKQYLSGPALIPNKLIYREYNDYPYTIYFSEETIESIVRKFFRTGKVFNTNEEHKISLSGNYIIESWIINDSSRDKAVSLGFDNLPSGTWMVTYHVPNKQYWDSKIETGSVKGFSVEGIFQHIEETEEFKSYMSRLKNEDSGILMLEVDIPKWEELQEVIDEEDIQELDSIYVGGREKNPHVTLLYGFDKGVNPEEVRKLVKEYSSDLEIRLVAVNRFEQDDYDVLKFEIESETLRKINEELVKNFPHIQLHKEFNPHITIAYLKKNVGKKYDVSLRDNGGIEVGVKDLVFKNNSEDIEERWEFSEHFDSYTDYPKAASDNANKALKWKEENGSECGTRVGWAIRKTKEIDKEKLNQNKTGIMSKIRQILGLAKDSKEEELNETAPETKVEKFEEYVSEDGTMLFVDEESMMVFIVEVEESGQENRTPLEGDSEIILQDSRVLVIEDGKMVEIKDASVGEDGEEPETESEEMVEESEELTGEDFSERFSALENAQKEEIEKLNSTIEELKIMIENLSKKVSVIAKEPASEAVRTNYLDDVYFKNKYPRGESKMERILELASRKKKHEKNN